MPDGFASPSRAQAMSNIGAGIMDTYFPALAREREKTDNDKRYEQQIKLQALHTLMQAGNLRTADVPSVMSMWAKEAGIHNDPGVQEVIDHMRKAATEQVPYGAERETAQSQADRLTARAETPGPSTTPIATSIAMRSVPPEPQTQTVMGTQVPVANGVPSPTRYVTDPNAPTSITTPALRVVPPEPVMYQPTRTLGDLTQDEYADERKGRLDTAHQEALLKKQSQLAEEMGDRQAQREADRQLAQLTQIRARAQEARKTQDQLFENKIKMLDPETQAKAKLRVAQIETALSAQNQNPNITQEEIHRQAGQMAVAEIQVGTAAKQAQIEKSKAQISHWKNIDARALVAKGGAATQGMTAGQARIFRVNTLDILPDLNATRSQLQKLQTDLALLGGKDPAIEARIKELSDQQDGLLLRLKDERDKILGQVAAPATGMPGAVAPAQPSRRPASDPLGLFK